MIFIIFALYFIILICFVLSYFFIIYHLIKYSLNPGLRSIMLTVFIVMSTLLLISNVMLFFVVDWSGILRNLPFN